jgi:hypothetical protein
MFKIAAGNEGVIQPFIWGTNSQVLKLAAYQVLSFDILGGAVTRGSGFHAYAAGSSALATQTINTGSYSAPCLAVSFAGRDDGDIHGTATPAPNQSFSETPDQDIAWGLASPANAVRGRTKFRLFQNVSAALTSISNASPAVFTKSGHGLAAGDKIKLTTTGALPTGLSAGTVYYVISTGLTSSTFRVSTTSGGSSVNTSSAGSGTHSFIKQPADVTTDLSATSGLNNQGLLSFPLYLV